MNQCVLPIALLGKRLFLCFLLVLSGSVGYSQTTIEVEVLAATNLDTDCDDVFSAPDILTGVSIQTQNAVYYGPAGNLCYETYPNLQYQETFNCFSDIPLTIEVCFEVFENDNIFCGIDEDCSETSCENLSLPPPGSIQSHTITVDGASRGSLELEIRTQGLPFGLNDLPCGAFDLGELPLGGSLGDVAQSQYNNFCGTSASEPNPESNGGFDNDQGVWFSFTTGNSISSIVTIESANDPENLGDPIDLQLALYQADTCTQTFDFLQYSYVQSDGLDETLRAECLQPNTRYFLMVDAAPDAVNGREGYFGLQISDPGMPIAASNDLPCFATDLGLLPFGGTLGDTTLSNYNNFCASSVNEPNPESNGGFDNDQGVWFTFTTDDMVSSIVFIDAVNDPQDFGDSINLQLALYQADTCTQTLDFVQFRYNASDGPNETLRAECLLPNTQYFLLVDIASNQIYGRDGYFGLHLSDPAVTAAADLRCDAAEMGEIPEAGFVELLNQSNHCADDAGEPDPSAFSAQQNVWFTFVAPPSRHVLIEVISDLAPPLGIDPINSQIAVWRPFADQCNFFLYEQASIYTIGDFDEQLEMECLEPGVEYYIMIDGAGNKTTGIFDIRVSDAGPLPPVGTLMVDTLLCAGQTLTLGDSTYTQSGLIDQMVLTEDFCDSLITGQLTVLPPISTTFDTTICFGDTLFIGSFPFQSTGPFDATLTTAEGCDSLVLGFLTVLPENRTVIDTVICAGESVVIGDIAYSQSDTITDVFPGFNSCDSIVELQLQVLDEIVTSIDTTVCAGESVVIGSSVYNTSGSYQDLFVSSPYQCDSTVFLKLTVLEPLEAAIVLDQEASGYQDQDGIATASTMGGDGDYNYLWETGATSATAQNLEGGLTYCVTVTDGIGCSDTACQVIFFPVNLLIDVEPVLVPCSGDLGSLTFSISNGQAPYDFELTGNGVSESGSVSQNFEEVIVPNLPAGSYTIEVSDVWGGAVTSTLVIEPEPITIQNSTVEAVSCFGACDGEITIVVSGGTPPYNNLMDSIAVLSDLCGGTFEYQIVDANGCQSDLFAFAVPEPEEFIATATSSGVTCLGENDGEVEVNTNGTPNMYLWNTGDTTAQVNGLFSGNYSVTVTDINGCTAVATTEVVEPLNELMVDIEEIQPISCWNTFDGALRLITNATEYTALWNVGLDQDEIRDLPPGFYSVTVTENTGCTAEASFQLNAPTQITADFDITDIDCRLGDDSGAIEVMNVNGGTGPYLFALSDNDFVQTNRFELLTPGTYLISVQDAFGCVEAFTATVNEPFPVEVDAGPDITIALGETVRLNASTPLSSDFTTVWTPGDSVICDNQLCLNPEVQPLVSTLYSIGIIEDNTGCSASDQVWVYVSTELPLYFPNTFTPNADGFNDEFLLIASPAVEQVLQFQVFDRWGAVLHSRENFHPDDRSHGWDGTHRGDVVEQGVYVFFAEVLFKNQEVRVFTGDVTVLR